MHGSWIIMHQWRNIDMLRANIIFNTSKLYIFYINDIRVSFDNFSALSSLASGYANGMYPQI